MNSSFDGRFAGGAGGSVRGRTGARLSAIGAAVLCLGGCTGGSYSSTGSYQELYPGERQTGIFKPGNISGLSYVSGDQSGVTGADGEFECVTTQEVSFSLGSVDLGSALCASIVHPASFSTNGLLADPGAVNLVRFLMLLDADQNFDNGIDIPQSLRNLADTWPGIDFSAMDLEGQLTRVLADIASVESRPVVSVPSSTAAFELLDSSLSCAYSGLFVNTFASGAFLAPTDVVLTVFRGSGDATARFTAQISRKHPQSFMLLSAAGTVELGTLPTFNSDSGTGTGTIDASYLTPDIVGGNWADAVAQQSIDRVGSFQALRIGRDWGDYRFVGGYSEPFDATTDVPLGVATLILDGDTVTGEMFDLAMGASYPISGTRLPGTDQIEFSTSTSRETATATLVYDGNGGIVGLQGGWPDIADSTLQMDGCLLN